MLRRASRSFGPAVTEVREARGFSNRTTRGWGAAPEVVELVVSELAANAVVHARSAFTVAFTDDGDCLRIEVRDASSRHPAVPHAGITATHGRGLLLVDRLARTWGCRDEPGGGKSVWVELPHASPRPDTGTVPGPAGGPGRV
jgi:hypothetical protein